MGVTYKLKDEIVDCILRQKRENPQISCRKLVAVIEETFHVNVSKSSVNAVIKEAHLSSPVGRTPSDKTQGFKIPHEKKVQLFGEPNPAVEVPLEESAVPSPLASLKPNPRHPKEKPKIVPRPDDVSQVPIILPPPVLIDSLPAVHEAESVIPVASESTPTAPEVSVPEDFSEDPTEGSSEEIKVSLLPDPMAQASGTEIPADPIENPRAMLIEPSKDEGKEHHYEVSSVGPFLLRAALWDLMRRPALETFLKRRIGFSDEEVRIADVLLCLPQAVWEDAAVALDGNNAWIWPVSGFADIPSQSSLQKVLDRVRETRMAGFDYFLELSYFFSTADRIKIILKDRSEICLDGRLLFLNSDPQRKFLPCPVDKSVENVTQWVSGEAPLVIEGIFSERLIDDLRSLIACCQNISTKQIERITVSDGEHEPFLDFANAPSRQRGFVFLARMPLTQLEAFVRMSLVFDPKNVIKRQDQDCVWAELKATIPIHNDMASFQIVAVPAFADKTAEPGIVDVIFTNFMTDKTFLNHYLGSNSTKMTQPIDINMVESFYRLREQAFLSPNDSQLSLAEGFKYFIIKLKDYISLLCFVKDNDNEFFTSISQLKGSVIINDQKIYLNLENNPFISLDLEKIINILNSLDIRNYDNKVLKLNKKEISTQH